MDYKDFIECGYHHPKARTLSELIEYISKTSDNGICFHTQADEEIFLSYKELYLKASICAAQLLKAGIKDVAVLCIDDIELFTIIMWGCIIAGIPLAPIQPLNAREIEKADYSRLINICAEHKECTIITESKSLAYYLKLVDLMKSENIRCVSAEAFMNGDPMAENVQQNEYDTIVIQYSSGSTGNPKGVKLTHRNIMYAVGALVSKIELTKDTTCAIWTPLFHNMGLFIPITALQTGNNIDIFHPSLFIQNPKKYFDILAKKKIQVAVSNNFGLEWAIKNVNTDSFDDNSFKALTFFVIGSEVVSENTLRRFYEKFKKFGLDEMALKPCYGLTEAVIAVSITGLNEHYSVFRDEKRKMDIVGNGKPLPGIEVRIVDEEGNPINFNESGEIQIKSTTVASSYIGSSSGCCDRDGWFSTGDVGFLKDGNLYINGRKKNMIIIRGHNYMLQDIENEISSLGLISTDSFSLCHEYDAEKKEEILIFFTSSPKTDDFLNKIHRISDHMIAKYGFAARFIVFLDSICRTGSGKIDRIKMMKKYNDHSYIDCIAIDEAKRVNKEKQNSKRLESIITDIWSELSGIDKSEINENTSFYEYIGDSVKQYQMIQMINSEFGLHLQPAFFREFNTIKRISEGLVGYRDESKDSYEYSEKESDEIAVTGFSFRLPGASDNEQLWDILINKKCMISKISDERKKLVKIDEWDNYIGEIDNIDMFDAGFFDISEKEAKLMDPQHRLILETSYEALESAAEAIIHNEPKNVGVFVDLNQQTYLYSNVKRFYTDNGVESLHEYTLADNLINVAAARIAHFYNFNGVAMGVDTACSSFLAGLHNARRLIQSGDISSAIVSSAHVCIDNSEFMLCEKAGFLSKSGRSKVFDKDADGAVLGEGVVSVFIEPLKNAIKNKKHIYAVIKGSAVNNDGYSLSIMAPSSEGQNDVLNRAYKDAGISPERVTYIEAHGTGTKIGDPIELHSLVKMFTRKKGDPVENRVGIGSIKSNIGHLLPAASGAGFIKLLNCFDKRMLVPMASFENINESLRISRSPFYIVDEVKEWNVKDGETRIAGITSLGIGGTNAHMILEEYEQRPPEASSNYYPIIISAKSNEALMKKISDINSYIKNNLNKLGDISYTLCCGRMSFNYRAGFVINKSDIDDSTKRIKTSVFKRVRNVPVYIFTDKIIRSVDDIKAFKKKINLIDSVIPYKGVFLGNGYLSKSEISDDQFIENLNYTDKWNESFNVPKIHLGFGIDSNDYDVSCSYESLSSEENLLDICVELFLKGAEIKWNNFDLFNKCGITELPKYPFEHKSYWV